MASFYEVKPATFACLAIIPSLVKMESVDLTIGWPNSPGMGDRDDDIYEDISLLGCHVESGGCVLIYNSLDGDEYEIHLQNSCLFIEFTCTLPSETPTKKVRDKVTVRISRVPAPIKKRNDRAR